MIDYIIVDDEINNIEILKRYLDKFEGILHLVGTAIHAEEATVLINDQKPELVFLDIQMPDKNGFDLLQALEKRDFEVIFVTAYDKFGIQAIKFSALDYLLKPLNFVELETALEKAISKIKLKKYNLSLENLIQNLTNKQRKTHKIALPAGRETLYVSISNIIRCQADNNYTEIYLTDRRPIIISKTLKEYDDMLYAYGFIRTHQSHLINSEHILSINKGQSAYILMKDNSIVPIARQKKEYVFRILSKSKTNYEN